MRVRTAGLIVALVAGALAGASPAHASISGVDCDGYTYVNNVRWSDYFDETVLSFEPWTAWQARAQGFPLTAEQERLADLYDAYTKDNTLVPSPTSAEAWTMMSGDAGLTYEFGDERSVHFTVHEVTFDRDVNGLVPGDLVWETTVHKPDTCDYPILTDVSDTSFARQDIKDLFDLKITTGTSDTTYGPGDLVSRMQMAAFIDRTYTHVHGSPAPIAAVPFTDMPGNFADDAIRRIFGLDITTGDSATTYGPDGFVTREQMAAFLMRLYRALGGIDPAPPPVYPFTDVSPTSFVRDDIAALRTLGITTGTSATTFTPDGFVTREQMAAFLMRLIRLFD